MSETNSLDPSEVVILKFLASRPGATADLLTHEKGISSVKAEYYLTKLEESGLIFGNHFYGGRASRYQLAQKGREFLVVNGHVD
jgi:predicted transcriptional regulator